MTSNDDFRGMSAFEQFNYTNRSIADAYFKNRPEQPISRLFGTLGESPLVESTSDRLIKASAKSVKDNLSKLLLTLQRIKGMLPNPSTVDINTGFSDMQISSLRNYLILDRMLSDRDVGGVIMQRNTFSVSEAAEVIDMLSTYNRRETHLPEHLLRDSNEYRLALHEYFIRLLPVDGRGLQAFERMVKFIPDFDQNDRAAFEAYQASLNHPLYDNILNGQTTLPLLEFVKKGITYTFNPFIILEKGANTTTRETQFQILTLFKYRGLPSQYPRETRDVFNMFYKITNSYNWDRELYFSAPKLNEGQLPLLLRLTLESNALIDQLGASYTEYIANMHKYPKAEIEQNVKEVEAINNITMELYEDRGLWIKSTKSPRNFPNIVIRRPSSRTSKRPLRQALHTLGNKAIGEFKGKWDQLAAELARDPRVVNPPP